MTTPSLQEMIANTVAMMSSSGGAVLMLREFGTLESDNQLITALEGGHGGLAVEGIVGGTAIPVSGTVTATVDTSLLAKAAQLPATLGAKAGAASLSVVPATDHGLATGTKQDEHKAVSDEITGASLAYGATGAITASDDTVYSPVLKVIWATGAGNLALMLADDTSNVVTVPIAANERISEFRIKKVMAATTATGISGAS